jgi:chromosome segregation ATPase
VADDWKAWLELTLLVAVTLLAVGRWIFGRETFDQNQANDIGRHTSDLARLRERAHGLAADLNQLKLQQAVMEGRIEAIKDRLARLEGKRQPRDHA